MKNLLLFLAVLLTVVIIGCSEEQSPVTNNNNNNNNGGGNNILFTLGEFSLWQPANLSQDTSVSTDFYFPNTLTNSIRVEFRIQSNCVTQPGGQYGLALIELDSSNSVWNYYGIAASITDTTVVYENLNVSGHGLTRVRFRLSFGSDFTTYQRYIRFRNIKISVLN